MIGPLISAPSLLYYDLRDPAAWRRPDLASTELGAAGALRAILRLYPFLSPSLAGWEVDDGSPSRGGCKKCLNGFGEALGAAFPRIGSAGTSDWSRFRSKLPSRAEKAPDGEREREREGESPLKCSGARAVFFAGRCDLRRSTSDRQEGRVGCLARPFLRLRAVMFQEFNLEEWAQTLGGLNFQRLFFGVETCSDSGI